MTKVVFKKYEPNLSNITEFVKPIYSNYKLEKKK